MTLPLVIAHRGASGYLPEHTLVGKALAFGMGADYLEQDVVATRDDELIVFHDLTLDQATDVARHFPGRHRPDGHYYCRDFTIDEIRSLTVRARPGAGEGGLRYPGRFPDDAGSFGIATLAEELRFIRGLNCSTGHAIGIYPEIKEPQWHQAEGIDIGRAVLHTLNALEFAAPGERVFLQSFDAAELRRLRRDAPAHLAFVQLLDGLHGIPTAAELTHIATYAQAIGPSIRQIFRGRHESEPDLTTLVADAHAAGLAVHPYTFRRDDLPGGIGSFDELLELFLDRLGVDGIFTDFPDLARRHIGPRDAAAVATP